MRSFPLLAASLVASVSLAPTAGAAWPTDFFAFDVASGWSQPVGLTFAPDGRLFVWEKAGRVWLVENGVRASTPVLDLSQEVGDWRDYGMLGFALDPDYLANGRIYAAYVVDYHHARWFGTPTYNPTANEYFRDTIGRVTRYTCTASDGFRTADLATRAVLVGESLSTGVPICHQSHGIGSLVFGADGTLLLSTGDAASYDEVDTGQNTGGSSNTAFADGIITSKERIGAFRAQLVDSHDGKILRIDPQTGDGVASNPFFDATAPRAPRSRVWALGLRNPCRMLRIPGTGASDPAAANPGVLLFGDVGWNTREEFHTCDGPAQNFGWPLYEGLTQAGGYFTALVDNQDAPNPLAGGACPQFFDFQNLLVQETLAAPSWPNPCNTSQQVPASLPRFMHRRPWLDYGHGNTARTGIFVGNNAAVVDISHPSSPLPGQQFVGNCAIGGAWYTSGAYPSTWNGSLFVADYVSGVVRNVTFDASHRPTSVRVFGANGDGGAPVALATDPLSGDLHYIDYLGSGRVRRIVYAVNTPPIAVATPAVSYGATPLTVTFDGSASSDPQGQALTYHWDFADGTTSNLVNPTHVFTRFDDVTALGTIISRVSQLVPPGPQGGGNPSASVIRDGIYPPVGSQDDLAQFDTFHNGAQNGDDWIGYTFTTNRPFRRLVFQEGKHFGDGGWWDDVHVEVYDGSTWSTVAGSTITPLYPGNNGLSFETFVVDFPTTSGRSIRLRGNPGGSADFISVGELRVYTDPHPAGSLRRNVTLRVTDTFGAWSTATVLVSLDNTPPQVTITSPLDGWLYSTLAPTPVQLSALVTDAEHPASQIFCVWQPILHHDEHTHPEFGEPSCDWTTQVDPLGCDGHLYFYEFRFTAMDAGGLTTEVVRFAYPDCCPSDGPPNYCLFCSGDGSGTPCPCDPSIAGNGCPNSLREAGAHLGASGIAQVSADTLLLSVTDTPNSTVIFLQADDAENGGAGALLGDGLLCINNNLVRLQSNIASSGIVRFPEAGDPSISVRGAVPAAGATRNYQVWYRNPASFCTPATFNTTNGVRVSWVP